MASVLVGYKVEILTKIKNPRVPGLLYSTPPLSPSRRALSLPARRRHAGTFGIDRWSVWRRCVVAWEGTARGGMARHDVWWRGAALDLPHHQHGGGIPFSSNVAAKARTRSCGLGGSGRKGPRRGKELRAGWIRREGAKAWQGLPGRADLVAAGGRNTPKMGSAGLDGLHGLI